MKIITLSAAFLLAMGLTSCKKDFTCDCDATVTIAYSDPDYSAFGGSAKGSTSQSFKEKESDAKEACAANDETITETGSDALGPYTETSVVKCTLTKK